MPVQVAFFGDNVESFSLTVLGVLVTISGLACVTFTGLYFGSVREAMPAAGAETMFGGAEGEEASALLEGGSSPTKKSRGKPTGVEGKPWYFWGVAAAVSIGIIESYQLVLGRNYFYASRKLHNGEDSLLVKFKKISSFLLFLNIICLYRCLTLAAAPTTELCFFPRWAWGVSWLHLFTPSQCFHFTPTPRPSRSSLQKRFFFLQAPSFLSVVR